MHEHCEVVIPPTSNVAAYVKKLLSGWSRESGNDAYFYDYYTFGGLFYGAKPLVQIPADVMEDFEEKLHYADLSVSTNAGYRPRLLNKVDEDFVDGLWRSTVTDAYPKCLLFAHSFPLSFDEPDPIDVCQVKDIDDNLVASRVIIAGENNNPFIAAMQCQVVTNGIQLQRTAFSGRVKDAISDYNLNAVLPLPADWLCVTVDLHR